MQAAGLNTTTKNGQADSPQSFAQTLNAANDDLGLFVAQTFDELILNDFLFLNLDVHHHDLHSFVFGFGTAGVQTFVDHATAHLARGSETKARNQRVAR